jgi:hypothetical protein
VEIFTSFLTFILYTLSFNPRLSTRPFFGPILSLPEAILSLGKAILSLNKAILSLPEANLSLPKRHCSLLEANRSYFSRAAGGGRGKTLGEERIDPQISQITQIKREA